MYRPMIGFYGREQKLMFKRAQQPRSEVAWNDRMAARLKTCKDIFRTQFYNVVKSESFQYVENVYVRSVRSKYERSVTRRGPCSFQTECSDPK